MYLATTVDDLLHELQERGFVEVMTAENAGSTAAPPAPSKPRTVSRPSEGSTLSEDEKDDIVFRVLTQAGPKKDTVAYRQALDAGMISFVAPQFGIVIEGGSNLWRKAVYNRLMNRTTKVNGPGTVARLAMRQPEGTREQYITETLAPLFGMAPAKLLRLAKKSEYWKEPQPAA